MNGWDCHLFRVSFVVKINIEEASTASHVYILFINLTVLYEDLYVLINLELFKISHVSSFQVIQFTYISTPSPLTGLTVNILSIFVTYKHVYILFLIDIINMKRKGGDL